MCITGVPLIYTIVGGVSHEKPMYSEPCDPPVHITHSCVPSPENHTKYGFLLVLHVYVSYMCNTHKKHHTCIACVLHMYYTCPSVIFPFSLMLSHICLTQILEN